MAADQAAAAIQTIINEFNGLQYRDSTTDEKINTAHSLLDQLAGTEYYDSLSPQLEAAINRVMSLPKKEESGTKPQEVGPGVTRPSETTTPVFPGDMEPGGGDGPDQGPDGSDYGPIQVEPGM